MIMILGQASSFDVGPSLSISRKIIRAQLAIVLPLGYTPLKLSAIKGNPIYWWA
jgi:hypothetical protein